MSRINSTSSFFFNDTATTEIYTLSLHDALPISAGTAAAAGSSAPPTGGAPRGRGKPAKKEKKPDTRFQKVKEDRKSTRLNSSHSQISYAVFCLKKKKITITHAITQHYTRVRSCV